jgi:hypothetical protein
VKCIADLPEWVTLPAHVFTYFSGSHAPLCWLCCALHCSLQFLLYYCIAISLIESFSFLFSHCSLAYFTVCYKYCYVDLSSLSCLATACAAARRTGKLQSKPPGNFELTMNQPDSPNESSICRSNWGRHRRALTGWTNARQTSSSTWLGAPSSTLIRTQEDMLHEYLALQIVVWDIYILGYTSGDEERLNQTAEILSIYWFLSSICPVTSNLLRLECLYRRLAAWREFGSLTDEHTNMWMKVR